MTDFGYVHQFLEPSKELFVKETANSSELALETISTIVNSWPQKH